MTVHVLRKFALACRFVGKQEQVAPFATRLGSADTRVHGQWYYTIDASSGCVWDLRVVRSIEYVRRVKARGGGGMVRYLVH